ncbi:MATH domain and coiled-coil domain-containing protein At3g58250-like isoform X2 [Eucalyptus grandis]|nr:MATH domain and coiled-coil domain-containing protein At3g58250-like isoform X2 [Eucalyptus grandis]
MVGEQLVTSWKYLWKITNFNSLSSVRCLLIYPKGNRTNSLALYLSVANPTGLPDGWSRFALFKLTLVNQINAGSSKRKETEHIFTARESDWGFTSFILTCCSETICVKRELQHLQDEVLEI